MAGIETTYDHENGRTNVRWEECGIQFRSNLVEEGGVIPLHAHGYDHIALITQGIFAVTEVTKSGETKEYIAAAKSEGRADSIGYRVAIPAWHKHSFRLLKGPGEVLCMWGG